MVSVQRCVSLARLKYAKMGTSTNFAFASVEVWLCSSVHKKSCLELSNARIGSRSLDTASMLDDGWLANPKNDHKSVWLAGIGKSDTAFVIEESMRLPVGDS